MAPKRTFKGYRITEPIEIELESPDGEKLVARCVQALPGSVFLDLIEGVGEAGKGINADGSAAEMDAFMSTAAAAGAIFKVLKLAIIPEDWEAFKKFIDAPENGISVEVLAEITGYLSEQYTGARPPSPTPSFTPGS